jgi:uncharacterized protein YdhG (YjbR/CyaY superfamily)
VAIVTSPAKEKKTEALEKAARLSVRLYLAALPPAVRKRMQQIRTIARAVPGAVEHFSYGVPGFRLAGQPLIWYAAFKQHLSIYPITPALLRAHRIDVSDYETSKGTIRMPLSAPLPVALVKRLVRARAADARARGGARRK